MSRIQERIDYAKEMGVRHFSTEVSTLLPEYVLQSFRHFYFKGDTRTLCGSLDIFACGEDGYSATCSDCAKVKREMCAARREEGQRRAQEAGRRRAVQKMNREFAALFDSFDAEAGPPHFDEVDDAVLSRQLKRRAVLMDQDGEADAAYFLREAARRIDAIYDYKEKN